MTETNVLKATGSRTEHAENLEIRNRTSMGIDPTSRYAFMEEMEREERTPSHSSLEGERPSTSSEITAKHVTRLTPASTWLASAQLSDLPYRVIMLLLILSLWRSLAFSVSIRTASSSNPTIIAKDSRRSHLRCNTLFCYSVTLSIHKPEGLVPALSSQRPPLNSPILKRYSKDNKTFAWVLNGRHHAIMCSDAFMQDYKDIDADGGWATKACLAKCVFDNHGCEGVLYLVDRPFEGNCFFQHKDERPMFQAGERILGAKLLKD